jgi:hypothetical protein
VDTKKLSYRDSTRKKPARRALDRLRRRPHWRLAYSNDGVLLFRR